MSQTSDKPKKPDEEVIEVTWSGKKLFLLRSALDQWYNQSFEARDYFVKTHPWVVHEPMHEFRKEGDNQEKKVKPSADLSSYVVIHWNDKSLLLKREFLDEWYNTNPEERAEFIRDNPNVQMDL